MPRASWYETGPKRGEPAFRATPCKRRGCDWPRGSRWERRTADKATIARVESRHASMHERKRADRDRGGRPTVDVRERASRRSQRTRYPGRGRAG